MTHTPEIISQIQEKRGGRFKRGQSGNPKGKPPGTLNKAHRLALDLIAADTDKIVEHIKYRAFVKNDVTALKMLLDRISPPRRDAPTPFDMSPITTLQDTVLAQSEILKQVAAGELTPNEGKEVSDMINNIATAARLAEVMKRLEAMEQAGARNHAA